jgi:hypothetical protein
LPAGGGPHMFQQQRLEIAPTPRLSLTGHSRTRKIRHE